LGEQGRSRNGRPPCGGGILAGKPAMIRRTVGQWAGVFLAAASVTGCMSTGSGLAANSRTAGTPTAKANNTQWPSTAATLARRNQAAPKIAQPTASAASTAVAEATPKPIAPPSPPANAGGLTPPTPLPATDPQPANQATALTPNMSSMKSLTAGTPVSDG